MCRRSPRILSRHSQATRDRVDEGEHFGQKGVGFVPAAGLFVLAPSTKFFDLQAVQRTEALRAKSDHLAHAGAAIGVFVAVDCLEVGAGPLELVPDPLQVMLGEVAVVLQGRFSQKDLTR